MNRTLFVLVLKWLGFQMVILIAMKYSIPFLVQFLNYHSKTETILASFQMVTRWRMKYVQYLEGQFQLKMTILKPDFYSFRSLQYWTK